MNIPDHISESLETIFWVKILKFFDVNADPDRGSGNLFDPGSGIRDKHPGSARLVISLDFQVLKVSPLGKIAQCAFLSAI
jgi:hypothetical protein